MNNIFKNAKQWTEEDKNFIGLPRPFVNMLKDLPLKMKMFKLAKIIPIPWQSKAMMHEDDPVFNIIYENEDRVIPENICGYCGINISDDEYVVRWTDKNIIVINNRVQEPRASSDTMPMHLECMKQARKICPHMKKTKDNEYEYGLFNILKSNAINDLNSLNINK